jgi:hypothetical protein
MTDADRPDWPGGAPSRRRPRDPFTRVSVLFLLLLVWRLALPVPRAVAEPLSPPERGVSAATCASYRLLRLGENRSECVSRGLALATPDDVVAAAAGPPAPPADESAWRRRYLAALVVAGEVTVTAAKATLCCQLKPFNVDTEGFFGANTGLGGADKAAHFVDYYLITKEFRPLFQSLGFSEAESRWLAFGTAVAGGVVNEIADGFTKYGFSPEDIAMDVLGAGTALLVSATRTHDLVGFRTSHLTPDTYEHDVYSMDLKLAGVADRLRIDLGPLRYLLLSVTYGTKGYPNGPLEQRERQVGFEVGLNLEAILNDVGVRRNTWWGYALHLVADNVRFPFTAVGMRFDLNHKRWRGPNTGNYP